LVIYFLGLAMDILYAILVLMMTLGTGCHQEKNNENLPVSPHEHIVEPMSQEVKLDVAKDKEPPQENTETALIKVEIKLDPKHPENEDYRNDWYVGAHNIDDHARPLGPTYFAASDVSGKASIVVPSYMLSLPMVVFAENQAHPVAPPGTLGMGKPIELRAFVPANCHAFPVMVDQLTNSAWVYFYRFFAEHGAENWNPSQVDCMLWAKYSLAFLKTHEIQDILSDVSDTRTQMISLVDLITPLKHYPQFIYKTRPPLFFAEQRHDGGSLNEGVKISPTDHNDERFIHQFKDQSSDVSFFSGQELVDKRTASTVTVNEKGLLRSLCGNGKKDHAMLLDKVLFFHPDLIVNDHKLKSPYAQYDLDDNNFFGHIADYKNDNGALGDLNVKSLTVRHTNGLPKDHNNYAQACSVTLLADFLNTNDNNRDLKLGTGFLFTDLFDRSDDDDDENSLLDDAMVWYTSSGNRSVDNEDTWAIFFDTAPILDGGLKGGCDPDLFCDKPFLISMSEIFNELLPRYDMVQFFKIHPNFFPHIIEEALVVELLGFRKGNFRDVLHMQFDQEQDNLFIGLRADYELFGASRDGEEANFTTTITYINKHNMRETLALCYESADYLAQQQIDVLLLNKEIPVVVAANMIAQSRCFSNARANQDWQNYRVGLFSMNGHKQVASNLFIPAGWLGPDLTYEVYLKKFDEAVYQGPIGYFHTEFFLGAVLEIPTATEGDEVMFVAADACCNTFKVSLPAAPEFTDLYPSPGEKMLVDTTGLKNETLGLPAAPAKPTPQP
jgi:hypothetical protein